MPEQNAHPTPHQQEDGLTYLDLTHTRPTAAGARGASVLHAVVRGGAPGRVHLHVECAGCGTAPLVASIQLQLSSGLLFFAENTGIARALRARGWHEVERQDSAPFVHLLWTVRSGDVDFKRLQLGQLCNHFDPTDFTTKVGIAETLRVGCRWQACARGAFPSRGVRRILSPL